jgi:peptide/nickel transport system permease protein
MRRKLGRLQFSLGAACLASIVFLAAFGALISPHDANQQNLLDALQPPFDWKEMYILGTDQLGRDIFARMASGARVSLAIAVCVVFVSGLIGILYGALSGYLGGAWDAAMQKLVETVWAFPPILLAIIIVSLFGQTLPNLIIALTVQRWIPYARLSRAQTLSLRKKEFVAASRVFGGGTWWILRKHIVPNLMATTVIVATFSMATAILAEASLSFLGLGVPSGTPSWGSMLADGESYVTSAWWLVSFPGLGIFLTVLGLNLLGDWLRDSFSAKQELNLL